MTTITTIASSDAVQDSRAVINANFAALQTLCKGGTAPTSPSAGQLWLEDDNPSSTVWTLHIYDGAAWIDLLQVDSSGNVALLPTGMVLSDDLDADSNLINNLGNATATTDAVNKGQVDARVLCCVFSIAGISATATYLLNAGTSASFVVSDVKIISDTATTGSDGSNKYDFQVVNVTQSNNLLSAAKSTNGAEISANTVYSLGVDQNATIAANDVLRLSVTKTGSPTSLASAQIRVQVNYKVTT